MINIKGIEEKENTKSTTEDIQSSSKKKQQDRKIDDFIFFFPSFIPTAPFFSLCLWPEFLTRYDWLMIQVVFNVFSLYFSIHEKSDTTSHVIIKWEERRRENNNRAGKGISRQITECITEPVSRYGIGMSSDGRESMERKMQSLVFPFHKTSYIPRQVIMFVQ